MEEEKKEIKEEIDKEKVKKETARVINKIVEENLDIDNIDILYKLVDIHKDISNEEYWKMKEEKYMRGYNGYSEGGNFGYGRRGVPGTGRRRRRYRGYGNDPEEMMEEMMEHYGNYAEANEEFNAGNYGAEGGMVKSVEGIMKNVYAIIEELGEADSPEVMQIIKKYAKKINEMQ